MDARIMAMLDRTTPDWWLAWADAGDLRDLAQGTASRDAVRARVARMFHPIIHAALLAGVVCSAELVARRPAE